MIDGALGEPLRHVHRGHVICFQDLVFRHLFDFDKERGIAGLNTFQYNLSLRRSTAIDEKKTVK